MPDSRRRPADYRERLYRLKATSGTLVSFQVQVRQSDLYIRAFSDLSNIALDSLLRHREHLESYIAAHPGFVEALEPLPLDPLAPPVVRDMLEAAVAAGVGPMAAVAGAMAEAVGRDLLPHSPEVLVENGGDIFLKTASPATISLFAGPSPLSERVGLLIRPEDTPLGVCTSSGSVGHSLSFGRADAACVIAPSAALADAAATALGNMIREPLDIEAAIDRVSAIPGVLGCVVIQGTTMGASGSGFELVPLDS